MLYHAGAPPRVFAVSLARMDIFSVKPLFLSFVKYALVGGGGAVLDFGTLMLAYGLFGWHYLVATAFGFIVGLVFVYVLSNLWVFNQRRMGDSPAREFAVFTLIGLAGLALTQLFMWSFVDGLGLPVVPAKLITMALVLCWNFGARKWILY